VLDQIDHKLQVVVQFNASKVAIKPTTLFQGAYGDKEDYRDVRSIESKWFKHVLPVLILSNLDLRRWDLSDLRLDLQGIFIPSLLGSFEIGLLGGAESWASI
jgi:hypothetical protein